MQQLTRFAADYGLRAQGRHQVLRLDGALGVLIILGMLYVFYLQNTEGLIVTGMTSQIHDGLYFANLVFLVGVAAGAVTIVFRRMPTTTRGCTRWPCWARCWRSPP
ncbi:MAG: hypothetical protein IPJ52_13995 [Rhodocyclaceae bacterium]|nr:hypothetical protein [Rhodocyclaceae bacterium]